MLLYIAATSRVVSIVIVVERKEEGRALPVQRPVYYLSEVLSVSKQNYPHYQKMCYGGTSPPRSCSRTFKSTQSLWSALLPLLRSSEAEMHRAEWPNGP